LARSKKRSTFFSSPGGTWKKLRNASISTSETWPSAPAILAPSAITPIVKPIWRSPGCAPSFAGGDARPSSEPIGSPLANRVAPPTILSQILMFAPLQSPAYRIKAPIATPTNSANARRR
jgi:hypothetical protein